MSFDGQAVAQHQQQRLRQPLMKSVRRLLLQRLASEWVIKCAASELCRFRTRNFGRVSGVSGREDMGGDVRGDIMGI